MKRFLALGGLVAVLGVAAAGVGIAQAQTPAPSATPSGQQRPADRYLAALAARLNISVDQLRQAMQDARTDVGLGQPGMPRGQGPDGRGAPGPDGRGGVGRGFGPGRGIGMFFGQQADALAGLFKISREQLLQELPGKTLAEVATAHGVSTQDVVNTIVATTNQHIDQMAQNRNVPADRVSRLKQEVSERAQEFVTTHRFPARGSGTRS